MRTTLVMKIGRRFDSDRRLHKKEHVRGSQRPVSPLSGEHLGGDVPLMCHISEPRPDVRIEC